MLTRLKVNGFKNLVDVDVRFGPFTCIAGPNGVGKSNLLDAIAFFGALADKTFEEAASMVRNPGARSGEIGHIFQDSRGSASKTIDLYAEMIVSPEADDDLGQPATASKTYLSYRVVLELRQTSNGARPFRLLLEELRPILTRSARKELGFEHTQEWRKAVITGSTRKPYISTAVRPTGRIVKLHPDRRSDEGVGGRGSGRPREFSAEKLPRTVLSSANAAESPTSLVARRELRSWRLYQLEPASLREPDDFAAPTALSPKGSHLASTLSRLAMEFSKADSGPLWADSGEASIYAQAANRVAELIGEVRDVGIDRDEKRQLLTLTLTDTFGGTYPARALSDGTLRFLALTVLELDPSMRGLICLEEPENGIHPERIPAMIQLLVDIAVDPSLEAGPDNPLRQVIATTHSPSVVRWIPPDSLLMASVERRMADDVASPQGNTRASYASVQFRCLSGTWRSSSGSADDVPLGKVVSYLSAGARPLSPAQEGHPKRIVDRADVRQLLLAFEH